jgi:hypothetical protein
MKPARLALLLLLFPLAVQCQDVDSLLKQEPDSVYYAEAPEDLTPAEPVLYAITIDPNIAFIGQANTVTFEISLGFQFILDEHLSIGIGDISYGAATLATGKREAFMAGPIAQYTALIGGRWSYYVFAGFAVQMRWGADIDNVIGVMPYGGAGVEFYVAPTGMNSYLTIGPFCKAEYVTTTKYLRSPRILPPSTVTVAGGVGFHFYF